MTITITGLPLQGTILDTSLIPVETSGVTGHIAASSLRNYLSASTLTSINSGSGTFSGVVTSGSLYTGAITATTINASSDVIIGGSLTVNGVESITGALTLASDVTAFGNLTVSGNVNAGYVNTGNLVATIKASSQPFISSLANVSIGNITALNSGVFTTVSVSNGTLNNVLIGASTPNAGTFTNVSVTNSTTSTSTTTGALKVVGGVGIGGSIYVGGTYYGVATGLTGTANGLTSGALQYLGTTAQNTSGSLPSGVTLNGVYSNGYPIPYGNVLNLAGGGYGQLLIGWSGTTGANADNYIRSLRDSATGTNNWSNWAKIYTDQNSNTITTIGTISNGTWNGSIISPAYGGTGVNNGTYTLSLGASISLNQSLRVNDTPNFAGLGINGAIYIGGAYGNSDNTDPMYITKIDNSSDNSEFAVYIGDNGSTSTVAVPTGDFFTIRSTNAGCHHRFGSDSTYANNGWVSTPFLYGTAQFSQYADLAERYLPDAEYEPGTVVVFGGEKEITTTTEFADAAVAGAISTNPAHLMNHELEGGIPLALRGRIPLKVFGPVTKGDSLVTSSVAGYAQSVGKDKSYGQAVFAKSLTTDLSEGEKVIEAVIL